MMESVYIVTHKSIQYSGKLLHNLRRLMINNLVQFLLRVSLGQVFNRCRQKYTVRRGYVAN